jgi:hypothetical protein
VINDIVETIRGHQRAYHETGMIGVYEHVLLKEAGIAADEIERLRADLAFYDNKCAKCGDHLGLLSECPHCREIKRLRAVLIKIAYMPAMESGIAQQTEAMRVLENTTITPHSKPAETPNE